MPRGHRPTIFVCRRLWLLGCLLCSAVFVAADDSTNEPPQLSDSDRIERLEQRLEEVVAENERLATELKQTLGPWLGEPPGETILPEVEFDDAGYRVEYDRGLFVHPHDLESSPFSLRVNHQAMFRYSGFDRSVTSWIDSTGTVNPVSSSSNFEIPRGRLIFSGTAVAPNLSYLVSIDYNTVTSNPIGFRAYSLTYRFNEGLEVHVGQNKVPGTREWLISSFSVQGPDRSMATTFFRPSLSQGIWFTGEPIVGWHYHAMLSNGFNTGNLQPSELDNRPCLSGSTWWEPWGKFGPELSDIEHHAEPCLRVGTSQTLAVEEGTQQDSATPENSLLRLSDGTQVTETGAFAPGLTLQQYKVYLAGFDIGLKYRGLTLFGELLLLDLFDLQANGPLPIGSTVAIGGTLQGGLFVLPRRFELYTRGSLVDGDYGTGGEYAGGCNWYPIEGQSRLRVTLDGAWLLRSPADQARTDYQAGQTGWLVRAQVTTNF